MNTESTPSKSNGFFSKSRNAKLLGVCAALVVVIGGIIAIRVSGSGYFVASEAETGTVATNASVVTDSNASGGKAIQFNAPVATTPPPVTTPPPSTGAWPTAYNTGVPHGLAGDTRTPVIAANLYPYGLKQYTGPMEITQDGTVIDGAWIDGELVVSAKNVVIKNSYLHNFLGDASGVDTYDSNGHLLHHNPKDNHVIFITRDDANLLVEDSEISAMASNGVDSTDTSEGGMYAIGRTGYTLLRDNVWGGGDDLRIDGQATVQDTWLHDPGGTLFPPTNGAQHNDVIQSTNATRVTVIHNRMDNPHQQTSNMLLKADLGPISNVTVKNNLFNGGGISFYWYDQNNFQYHITQGNGEGIIGNHFQRAPTGGYFAKGGFYQPTASRAQTPPATWSGNVWNDDGSPVALQ